MTPVKNQSSVISKQEYSLISNELGRDFVILDRSVF